MEDGLLLKMKSMQSPLFFGDAHLAVLEADDISKQRLVRVSSFQWRPLPPNITDVGGGQQAPRTFTDAGFTAVCLRRAAWGVRLMTDSLHSRLCFPLPPGSQRRGLSHVWSSSGGEVRPPLT